MSNKAIKFSLHGLRAFEDLHRLCRFKRRRVARFFCRTGLDKIIICGDIQKSSEWVFDLREKDWVRWENNN